jgi:phage FluMu gp28-like protein
LRKAKEFVRRLGVRVRGDGHNELSIAFPNGSRIVGLPENETTIRGFSDVSLLLVDEAARVPDEIYRAMRPTLVVHDGDLWLMSTPNGKRGFFWEEWEHGGEEWERISVPATDCSRISARVLAEEKANAGDKWYRQEYLCEFVDIEGAVFPRDTISGAYEDYEGLAL